MSDEISSSFVAISSLVTGHSRYCINCYWFKGSYLAYMLVAVVIAYFYYSISFTGIT